MRAWSRKGSIERDCAFFVRGGGQVPCPLCGGILECFGTRLRGCIQANGEKILLSLRRLRCTNEACNRIHHELPSSLVPYKRHACDSIESACTPRAESHKIDVVAENSTINRWKRWVEASAQYWDGSLQAISRRMGMRPGTKPEASSAPPLQRLLNLVGQQSGWMAQIVRSLVNAGLWVQTRSACMSGAS